MALVLKDRVKVLATTTGTGTFTLGAAVAGFQDFSVIGNGNTTYYTIVAQATPDWEVGIGTYTASGTLLSRDTILESSNGGAAVDFPAGTKDVFVTYPAERATYLDTAGAYPVQNTFNTLNAANAVLTAGTVSTTPLADTDIANKIYVDNLVASGIHFHAPVRVESPTALTVTYNNGASGVGATLTNAGTQVALVIDGVTVSVNDRVLIYTQADATQNGVYVVTSVGSGSTNWVLTRSDDTDSFGLTSPNTLGEGSTFFVQQGTTGAGETYTCNTVGTITFGTTNITFAQISSAQIYSAGTGLTLSGTQFSLSNTGTAGTYGSASNVPVFTTNAQGQVTAVTDTAIAIAAGAVSGLAASATTDTTNASNITTGTLPTGRLTGSYTGITGVGTLTAGTWNGSTIAAAYGGTGLSTFVAGDIIYADSSTTLARLADVAVGNALISGGAAADPSWGKIGLATHVDGTLPIANGGTNGAATPTAGGVAYGNGTAYAFSSAGTSGQVLTSSGTGAPSWTTLSSGTVTSVTGTLPISVATGTTTPVISISQAATASDGYLSSTDWNTFNNKTSNTGTVTSVGGTGTVNGITLTGTVTTSGDLTLGGTLSGVSLTTQVSGTLPLANGGTNATSAADARTNLDVPTRTGGNASGSWNINAATATTATNQSGGSVNATTGTFSGLITANGGTIQVGSSAGVYRQFRYDGTMSSNGSTFSTILNSANYNSYSPTLTGGGASGTWGISITGNAATVSNITANTGLMVNRLAAPSAIDGLTTTNFRSTLFGTTTNAEAISTARWNSIPAPLSGLGFYGTMMAWAASDTQGFLAVNYNTNGAIIGGGNGNNINWTAALLTSANFTSYAMPSGSSATNTVDVRAPIFYDSNDTGYYIDPNSTSNTALRMRGGSLFGPNVTWGAYLYVGTNGRPGTEASVCATNGNLHMDCQNGYAMYLNWYSNNDIYSQGNFGVGAASASHRLHVHGTGLATTDFRAPIFYDNNNTSYYVDPTGSTSLRTVGDWRSDSGGWTGEFAGKIQYHANNWYFQYQTDFIFRNSGGGTAFYGDASGNTFASASSRAPIFYDNNDTAYFCDPNSRSRFAALKLNTNNWITDSLDFNRIYFTQGDGTQIRGYSGTWYIQMGSTSTTTTIVEGAGNFYTTGAVTAYWSDKRLKKNINKIEDWREILSKINGYRFEWNDLGLKILGDSGDQERGIKVGVIAQEAKEALPQSAVVQLMQYESKTDGVLIPKKDIDYDPENPYLTVQMEKYIPVLIEASKGLMDENEQLKATIQSLVDRITTLEKKGI